MDTRSCPVCGLTNQQSHGGSRCLVRTLLCQRCGDLEWDITVPMQEQADGWVKVSGFVREQNAAGIVPVLTRELVRDVEHSPMPSLRDRSMRLIAAIVQKIGYDTNSVYGFGDDPLLLAVSYSAGPDELDLLLQILDGEDLISYKGRSNVRLTPAGCLAAEELTQARSASVQGFVAMWFDPSMNDAYTLGFDRGIRQAGYRPLRIDNKEHAGPISDAILAEIRRSRFVVADYTGTNNGVYFEAGFAMGLGIPVIPTCRADWLDKLHFDIRHINTLKWDDPQHLAAGLAKRVSAVLGDGPFIESGPSRA